MKHSRILVTGIAACDVAAGRGYVAAYVDFIHYVETLQQVAAHGAAEHGHEGAK